MSKLEPLAALTQAPPEALMQQRSLRHTALARILSELRAATSLESALVALSSHAEVLLALGRHDDAARLSAFARVWWSPMSVDCGARPLSSTCSSSSVASGLISRADQFG